MAFRPFPGLRGVPASLTIESLSEAPPVPRRCSFEMKAECLGQSSSSRCGNLWRLSQPLVQVFLDEIVIV